MGLRDQNNGKEIGINGSRIYHITTLRNAALNLTPVTGTTNEFIFQIIKSLIESWGVRLTWFDCKSP